ncbi:UPF0175 family protein [Leptolyngbya subtilissima DQ-A4]|uniref:UPF0175 family protein n=1 Tax=Leptolyngbya subtilissima DQ-A4 TaxID=2933933 RepID=A0ABV0K4B6_9CYAN
MEAELPKELALYSQELLSFGEPRELAGLYHWEFIQFLGERQLPRHYS